MSDTCPTKFATKHVSRPSFWWSDTQPGASPVRFAVESRRSNPDVLACRTMVLHFWLIPALIVLFLVLTGFYLIIKYKGGSGVRTDGRTVVDKPAEEDHLPPG